MQCDSSPHKKGKFGCGDRRTQGAHHVNMKAEIKVLHLQASDANDWQHAAEARREAGDSLPYRPTFRKKHSASALFLDSGPQN